LSRKKVRDPDLLLRKLRDLLAGMEYLVSAVVVEGPRDVEALRRTGFGGRVEICSRFNVSESDLAESLAHEIESLVILTDFDEEGRRINGHLTRLLETRGVKVEVGIRRRFGRLMAALGIHTIEALDDVVSKIEERMDPWVKGRRN
jgi:5S rRNA maturation endonuclease (ribonuclease M5)